MIICSPFQVLADCDKLLGELERVASLSPESPNYEISKTRAWNLVSSIASQLLTRRHYISSNQFDPRFLVFEFIRNMVLRKRQVELVNQFTGALEDPELQDKIKQDPGSVRTLGQQKLMGQGKTAIITPLLCLMLADSKSVPIVVLPDSLVEACRNILTSTLSSIIHKRVNTFSCG